MTPSTPPRSRERRSSMVDEKAISQLDTEFVQPETPHRASQGKGPVTPSTTTRKSQKELSAPLLAPPRERSPFRGFQSPEFTPFRELKEQEERDEQFPPQDLRKVSRVLFPKSFKDDEEPSSTLELLPPTRPTSSRSRKLSSESPTRYKSDSFKQPKQQPGTPSHKLTNFELAQKWHNNDNDKFSDSDDDDDDEVLIRHTKLSNPFQISQPVSDEIREQRKQSLLQSDPDVEDFVTYLDKNGEVTKRHRLSSFEKKAFKPKLLFANELQELESENEAAKGSDKD